MRYKEEERKERKGETRRGKEEIVRNERREEREGPNAIEILQKVKLRPRTKNPTKTSPGAKSYKDAPPFCPRGPWTGAGGRARGTLSTPIFKQYFFLLLKANSEVFDVQRETPIFSRQNNTAVFSLP